MVTYHCVFCAIHESSAIVTARAQTRSATEMAKRLESIFFHAPMQGRPRDSQCLGGATDVVFVTFQRVHDGGLFGGIETRDGIRVVLRWRAARLQKGKVGDRQQLTVVQDDSALNGMTKLANV